MDEARRVANRARVAHSVALRAFAHSHLSRKAARSARRRRHHRRQRHRRRHSLYAAAGRGVGPHRVLVSRRLAGGRRARVLRAPWRTPSSRRCGRARAASTSICARRTARSPAFMTGWTSFVAGFTGAIAASAIVTDFLSRAVHSRARPTARRCSSCRCRTCR